MGFVSTESWQGEDGRFFIETTRLPYKPFMAHQKNHINDLPLGFADSDAVEITWRNHFAGEPTECLIAIKCDDRQFEQIREDLSDVLHREEGEAGATKRGGAPGDIMNSEQQEKLLKLFGRERSDTKHD